MLLNRFPSNGVLSNDVSWACVLLIAFSSDDVPLNSFSFDRFLLTAPSLHGLPLEEIHYVFSLVNDASLKVLNGVLKY